MRFLHKERSWPSLALLAALLLTSFALGAWQTRARARNQPVLTDELIAAAASPVQRALASGGEWAEAQWTGLARGRRLAQDNRRLSERAARLETENLRLKEEIGRQRRLLPLLSFSPAKKLAAAVVGQGPPDALNCLILNRGRKDGLRSRLPVVAGRGVVGQIVSVTENTARVLPLTATESGAAALTQRTRAAGIVRGAGARLCEMRLLQPEADLRIGDLVITSGQGGIFPAGLPLGRIAKLENDSRTASKVALLESAVDFYSLQEVVVLLEE